MDTLKNLTLFSILFLIPFQGFASTCDSARPDLSLVLAIDVSSSVDKEEMETQLQGYKNSLLSPQIQNNLLNCQCTEISVVLWAQGATVAYPATQMKSSQEISELAKFFNDLSKGDTPWVKYGLSTTTEITNALGFSGKYLLDLKSQANSLVINISGDGGLPNNSLNALTKLRTQRQFLIDNGITINGIPIVVHESSDSTQGRSLIDSPVSPSVNNSNYTPLYSDVADFYDQEVRSTYGFLQKAEGYEDFPRVLQRSLERLTCNLIM